MDTGREPAGHIVEMEAGDGRDDASGGGRATISAINVTPLVDVVLVLLVILMVASTYIVAQTLKVQLPRAKSTDGTAEKPTKVEILRTALRWNEGRREPALAGKMKARSQADAEMSLVVSADKEVHARQCRARPRSREARRHHQVRHQRPAAASRPAVRRRPPFRGDPRGGGGRA